MARAVAGGTRPPVRLSRLAAPRLRLPPSLPAGSAFARPLDLAPLDAAALVPTTSRLPQISSTTYTQGQ